MTKEKDTNVDQVFALAIRIAKFLRKNIARFDGDLFQKAITNLRHPFWDGLEKLCETTFTIPFEYREIGEPCRITINDGRTTEMLLAAAQDRRGWVYKKAEIIFASNQQDAVNSPEEVEIVFLYPTRYVEPLLVIEEFKRRGWENASLDDSLRLIEKYPHKFFVSCGKFNHNIAFVNEREPAQNLELGYDGMNCPFLDQSDHGSLCYAARRRIKTH